MVRVVSCHFLRLSCSEDDHPLFRRYYARSNRERGIKLLRCFPHCCPEHVQRCYCGTSIHVQVTFASILPPAVQGNLLVCARFEPSRVVPLWPNNIADAPENDATQENERKLQPGEIVALPASLLAAGKRKVNQTVWIRADREGEVKQKTLPQNTVLYVLNNHRFPKWLYSYDSSVARTQREMTHHLVVYVFQLIGSSSQSEEIEAAVLARHESAGFSLVSYRRSGNNSGEAGCDLPAINEVSSTTFAAVEVDVPTFASTSDAMEVDSVAPSTPPGSISNFESKPEAGVAYLSAFASARTTAAPQFAAGDSDAAFWVYDVRVHRSGLAEKAKHLLILWHFLGYVTLSDAGVTSDTLNAQIQSHWLRAAGVLQASSGARSSGQTSQLEGVMSSFLLSLCRGTHAFALHQTATREQVAVQATAHLLLRALSSRAAQYAFQSAFTLEAGASVLAGGRISLPALVDEVVSVIYTQRQFTGLQSEVSGLLRGQFGTIERLFGCFTAQLQESIFNAQSGPDPFFQLTGSGNGWSREWLLDPGSIQVTSIPQGHKLSVEPSLVEFLRWIYEFACIEVDINEGGSRLMVRSVLPMINAMAPTEFLLDGRLRAFRSTPSGISSMLPTPGGWSFGDYAASFSGQANDLKVDFYGRRDNVLDASFDDQVRRSGQLENSSTVCWISMTFALEEHLQVGNYTPDGRDLFLFFRGVVARATYDPATPWNSQPKLSDESSASRSVVLRELQWTAELEIQGGYVAVPT
ncbi:hypothetical protein PC128_g22731 [Phytophthora cactorum]|nr:hypothetical protein PC120_g20997 [Phytophthora cactorum]KAG3047037.1 hypothetical protein PC121_g20305 [Phytophthora cactorum]KAG3152629.1 hypothetical protein PC128_g22731 [Phytophthora cactorum]